jgi:hypothetical protein
MPEIVARGDGFAPGSDRTAGFRSVGAGGFDLLSGSGARRDMFRGVEVESVIEAGVVVVKAHWRFHSASEVVEIGPGRERCREGGLFVLRGLGGEIFIFVGCD